MSGRESFEALRARAAVAGLVLVRTDPADGPQRFFLIQRRTVRELQHVEDLEALVNHLQGR